MRENIFVLENILSVKLSPPFCDVLEPCSPPAILSHCFWGPLRENPENKIQWDMDDLVYMYDLSRLKSLYAQWKLLFPNIHPYYAVKCNPNPEILKTLAKCGANFDCASPNEIKSVMNLGVPASKILYANPCKREADIQFMSKCNVMYTTFDSVNELDKIVVTAPDSKCILRIYANDPSAQCILSNKFGAFVEEWEGLLLYAQKLGIDVVGVSFHIGSGASNPHIFYDALRQAREVVELGKQIGFDIHIIDIGGGFSVRNITGMASSIHKAIFDFFPDAEDFDFIAEPGRYFAETIGTMYTKVMGVRERRGHRDYFITDSVYGSFNCIFYDHCTLVPEPILLSSKNAKYDVEEVTLPSTLFGPTCDGGDKIIDKVDLPRLQYGDWLRWRNMGAYTIAAACDFNGINFTQPTIIYI